MSHIPRSMYPKFTSFRSLYPNMLYSSQRKGLLEPDAKEIWFQNASLNFFCKITFSLFAHFFSFAEGSAAAFRFVGFPIPLFLVPRFLTIIYNSTCNSSPRVVNSLLLSDPSQCCNHWLQKEMNMIVVTVSLLMDKSVAFSVAQ